MSHYLALDLGAESGRGVLGALEEGRLTLSEIHRFPNQPVALPDGIHWDIMGLYRELRASIGTAAAQTASTGGLQGLGVDTWGVDYALVDARGDLLGIPYHYRDHRTDGMMERVFAKVSRSHIFEQTGIQFMQLNTLFQLAAAREAGTPALQTADRLMFLPDLLHYWLSGEKTCEHTIASTSQLYNPVERRWATELMDDLGIPSRLFRPLTEPGTAIGTLTASVADETGAGPAPVIIPGSHDTASAVAAAPATGEDFIYLSSGTWSLMGIELPAPAVTPAALQGNFTNEGGVNGAIRFLKNIMGLWVVQECRRIWAREGNAYSYAELATMASEAPAFTHFLNPDDPSFLAPASMPSAITAYCTRTGQSVPESPGAVVRSALEGLAFKYRETVSRLEAIAGRKLDTLHIVGGGVQNKLLCQFAANATGKLVVAGPVEATATGNILVQAMGKGEIGSLAELRRIVRASFNVEEYVPQDPDRWSEAYGQFTEVIARNR